MSILIMQPKGADASLRLSFLQK